MKLELGAFEIKFGIPELALLFGGGHGADPL